MIIMNDGMGGIAGVSSFGTGLDDTQDIAVGDVDGDGSLDIVLANQLQPGRYYLNDGSGAFSAELQYASSLSFATQVAVGDLDNDGHPEIVTASFNGNNTVYWNDGAGGFGDMPTTLGMNEATQSVALADINGDGYLDIAFGNAYGQNVIYVNDQMGGFEQTTVNFGNGSDNTVSIGAADLDGDGTLDLVLANAGGVSVVSPNASAMNSAPSITSTAPTTATVGVLWEYTVQVTGTPAPSITASNLPLWLSLDAGIISGTPSANDVGDTTPFQITADNGIGMTATETVMITISPADSAPMFTSSPVLVAAFDLPYVYTIEVAGFPSPTISMSNAPTWLALNGNVLSGTPAQSDLGMSMELTLSATNGIGVAAEQSFAITVEEASAPQITSNAPLSAIIGQPYTYTIVATGTPQPTITATGLPAWLTLSGNTLSGTPSMADHGMSGLISISADNTVGSAATQDFEINVLSEDELSQPRIAGAPATAAFVGQEYRTTVQVAGAPAPSIEVSGLPSWLSFDSASNEISGTPSAADIGLSDVITITLTNTLNQSSDFRYQVQVIALPGSSTSESTCALGTQGSSPLPLFALLLAALSAALLLRKRQLA